MTRILVRSTNWIGDVVMSLAALRELRRLYPSAHLAVLARPWVAAIYQDQGLVDEIRTLDGSSSNPLNLLKAARGLRNFDTTILFPNSFGAALLSFLARIPERIGYATDRRSLLLSRRAKPRIRQLDRHQIFYYLDLLYQTRVSPIDYLQQSSIEPDIRLQVTPRILERADALMKNNDVDTRRPLIALNPGASFGPAKRWFPERYAVLADRLVQEADAEVLLLGSTSEMAIAEQICSRMSQKSDNLVGQTDLPTLMGIISRCQLMVGNDSGPMHLAAALGVPQVAIFGSTDEKATGPFNPRAVVLHKHVECSPCLLRECPIDLRCFDRIQVDEVMDASMGLLNQTDQLLE